MDIKNQIHYIIVDVGTDIKVNPYPNLDSALSGQYYVMHEYGDDVPMYLVHHADAQETIDKIRAGYGH